MLDGKSVNTLPTEKNYIVEVKCDNNATGSWDYENWGPLINNITGRTKCEINYQSPNNVNTLAKILGVNDDSVNTILSNSIDKLVSSEAGMIYLTKSSSLLSALKSSSNYTTTVKQKILDSTVISEEEKYNAGLPFYLYKNGSITTEVVGSFTMSRSSNVYNAVTNGGYTDISWFYFENNNINLTSSYAYTNSYATSTKKVNLGPYDTLYFYYGMASNASGLSCTTNFGITSYLNTDKLSSLGSKSVTQTSISNFTTTGSVSSQTGSMYIAWVLNHGTEINGYSCYIKMYKIALY